MMIIIWLDWIDVWKYEPSSREFSQLYIDILSWYALLILQQITLFLDFYFSTKLSIGLMDGILVCVFSQFVVLVVHVFPSSHLLVGQEYAFRHAEMWDVVFEVHLGPGLDTTEPMECWA